MSGKKKKKKVKKKKHRIAEKREKKKLKRKRQKQRAADSNRSRGGFGKYDDDYGYAGAYWDNEEEEFFDRGSRWIRESKTKSGRGKKNRARAVAGGGPGGKMGGHGQARKKDLWGMKSGRDRVLQRVYEKLEHGREDDAAAIFDGRWPLSHESPEKTVGESTDESTRLKERMEALLSVWPDRAVREVCDAGGFCSEKEKEAFCGACLFLDGGQVERLAAVDSQWAKEARSVREAGCDVAEGRDAEARKKLRGVELRSPFRQARLFLRGLSAYYRRSDGEAERALGRLVDSVAFGRFCRILLWMIAHQKGESGNKAAGEEISGKGKNGEGFSLDKKSPGKNEPLEAWQRRVAAALGGGALVERVAVKKAMGHLGRQQINRALRELSVCEFEDTGSLLFGLVRELPMTCLSLDIDMARMSSKVKAFGLSSRLDPYLDGVGALMMENAGRYVYANELWDRYIEDLIDLDFAPPGWKDKYVAMIWTRMAKNIVNMVGNTKNSFLGLLKMDRYIASRRKPPEEIALEHIEKAIALDPNEIEHWLARLNICRFKGDRRDRGRVLEKMLELFPSNPEVLIDAAEEALHRKAVEKALRFATKAAELEPLGGEHRRLRCRILLEKARKRINQEKLVEARNLYEEVCRIARAQDKEWLSAQAERAVLSEALDGTSALRKARREALVRRNSPWLWTLYLLEGRMRLHSGKSGQVLGTRQVSDTRGKYLSVEELTDLIDCEINAEEANAFMSFLPDDVRKSGANCYHTQLMGFIRKGVGLGYTHITDRRLLKKILDWVTYSENKLGVAEHANRLFPEDPFFCLEKYELARKKKKPPRYFCGAASDLDEARQKLQFIADGGLDRNSERYAQEGWMALWQGPGSSFFARTLLSRLLELQRYIDRQNRLPQIRSLRPGKKVGFETGLGKQTRLPIDDERGGNDERNGDRRKGDRDQ